MNTAAASARTRSGIAFALVAALLLGFLAVLAAPASASHGGPGITVSDAGVDEGNSGVAFLTFTVTADPTISSSVTFDYATSDFTATIDDNDYREAKGTGVLTPANPTYIIQVLVNGDTKLEEDEFVLLGISNAPAAHILDGSGTGTIRNDEGAIVRIVEPADGYQFGEGDGTAELTVEITQAPEADVTVGYRTTNGKATSPDDYTGTQTGSVTIKANETTTTISIPLVDDTKSNEGNETFTVSLTSATSPNSFASTAVTVTITDNDQAVLVGVGDAQVRENYGPDNAPSGVPDPNPTTTLRVPLFVKGTWQDAFAITWSLADGTATGSDFPQSGDYTNASGSVSVNANASNDGTLPYAYIDIDVIPDTTPEPFETIIVTISTTAAGYLDGLGSTAVATILNDDVSLRVDDPTAVTENDGVTDIVFTVSTEYVSVLRTTFSASTANGTGEGGATAGEDYNALPSTSFELSARDESMTIPIALLDDLIDEADEQTFALNLANVLAPDGGSAAAGDPSGTGKVKDNDAAPTVSIASKSIQEQDAGTSEAAVTVTLTGLSQRKIDFNWQTQDGDSPNGATAGSDYTASSGPLTRAFNGTTTSWTIFVPVLGDTTPEEDETVNFVLSNLSNVQQGTLGALTIVNDDESLAIEDAAVDEADTTVNVTIRIGKAQDHDITMSWKTQDGNATAGSDYVAVTTGTAKILANQTTTTVPVTIKSDTTDEPNETFRVVISNPSDSNVVLIDDTATVTIRDDDGTSIRIDDVAVVETDSSSTTATFTVSLTQTSTSAVTFDYETQNGTATGSPLPGQEDYLSVSTLTGSGSIAAGSTSTTIPITINGDGDVEPDETFSVVLSNVANATVDDDTGIGTIQNDDAAVSIADAQAGEGTGSASFVISIAEPSVNEITVDYATADGTAKVADGDYTAKTGTATIPAGSTSTTVTVAIIDDSIDEDDETFAVSLTNPTGNASIGDGSGTGTITDNDKMPTISINDVSVNEPDAGSTADVVSTVTLSAASGRTVTIDWATGDGTATPGEDYAANSGTLTFEPGQTSLTITTVIAGDDQVEPNETYPIDLSNPSEAVLERGSGTVTIIDSNVAANLPPTIDAGPDRTVDSYLRTTFAATIADPDGDTLTVSWGWGDGSGNTVGNPSSHAFPGPGPYTITATVTDGKGGSATDTMKVTVTDAATVTRESGKGRILTAIEASKAHWVSSNYVVLAHARGYADALAAGPLAYKLDAPLLLSDQASVAQEVLDELGRLKAKQVWIVGGNGSISADGEKQLKDRGYQVLRISGKNRYATAREISRQVGVASSGEVILALGFHAVEERAYADALSAGALAVSPTRMPVLLTAGDALPSDTESALSELKAKKVWLLGGTGTISANVEARLQALGYRVERLSGSNRYGTSVAVATEALTRYGNVGIPVVFATGKNYPDGLAATAVAGRIRGIVLLVHPTDLAGSEEIRTFLKAHADQFDVGVIIGGDGSVSEAVRNALLAAMDK